MAIYRINVGNGTNRTTVTADGSQTLRDVFEANEIEIGNGAINLDGSTIKVGDLDRSLDDFGLDQNTQHMLRSVAKLENAAKAIVAGGNMIVTSAVTRENLELVKTYAADAMSLKNEDGDVEFMASVGKGKGSLGKYGVEWGEYDNAEGYPTLTLEGNTGSEGSQYINYTNSDPTTTPSNHATTITSHFKSLYGFPLVLLSKLEDQINAALPAAVEAKAQIDRSIEVL